MAKVLPGFRRGRLGLGLLDLYKTSESSNS